MNAVGVLKVQKGFKQIEAKAEHPVRDFLAMRRTGLLFGFSGWGVITTSHNHATTQKKTDRHRGRTDSAHLSVQLPFELAHHAGLGPWPG